MTTITSWHINWGDGGSSDVTIPTGSSPLVSTPPHTYAVASVLGYAVAITATGKNAGGSTVQLDMPHLELPLATAPFLPDAIYQGPVPEPAYFSEFDTFAPPVRAGSSGASGTPSIDEFTRSAGPNQSIAVTAESLTTQASPSANDDTSFLTYGQTTVADGVLAPARIQTIDDQKTSLTLPASLTPGSIYLLWPHNSLGYGNPVVVNQPELWWADTSTAYSGQRMSLYGRNLSYDSTGPGLDSGQSFVFPDKTWVYLQDTATQGGQWIAATASQSPGIDVNAYKVDFTLPTTSTPVTYKVWVNNGRAGHYSWSNALQIVDSPAVSTSMTVLNGDISEGSIQAAINSFSGLGIDGNGVVHIADLALPARTIELTSPLFVNAYVHLEGAGEGQTIFHVADGSALSDAIDLRYQAYAGLSNLSITADDVAIADTGAVVQLGSSNQTFDHISITALNFQGNADPTGYSPTELNESVGSSSLRITNCSFTGSGIFVGASADSIVDNCAFVGAGVQDSMMQFDGGFNDGISVTRCTVHNYSDDPIKSFSEAARVFHLNGDGNNVYVGDNQSFNMFPEQSLSSQLNGGEQLVVETGDVSYQGHPAASVGSGELTVSFDSGTVAGSVGPGQTVAVTAGPGLGKVRIVTAISGDIITVDRPWAVPPTTDSTLTVGTTTNQLVAYQNNFSGDGVQSFQGNSSGIQTSGGYNLILDSNALSKLRSGVVLNASSLHPGEHASPALFNVVTNNLISDVKYGLVSFIGSTSIAADVGSVYVGNVWRKNSIQNVHLLSGNDADTHGTDFPASIEVSDNLPDRVGQTTTNVFEANVITDTPIGAQLTPGGNLSVDGQSATINTLFRQNNFTFGNGFIDPVNPNNGTISRGIFFDVDEANAAMLVQNSYSSTFSTNYFYPSTQTLAPHPLLSVPFSSFDVNVTTSPLTNVSPSLLIGDTGTSAATWRIDTATLPSWLTLGSASGIITGENNITTVALNCNSAGLARGTYSTVLKIYLGGTLVREVTVQLHVGEYLPPPGGPLGP